MAGFVTLSNPPGFVSGFGGLQWRGINGAGQIAGWYSNSSGKFGFLYSGGTYTSLTDPSAQGSPPTVTEAFGINDNTAIVGFFVSLNPLVAQGNNEFGFRYHGGS